MQGSMANKGGFLYEPEWSNRGIGGRMELSSRLSSRGERGLDRRRDAVRK